VSDEHYMRLALEQAKLAFAKGEIPVGAVAVYKGKVIGSGHNVRETTCNPLAHAEMIALEEAARTRGGWRLFDVTLYCTMEPCPMCAGALIQARIERLVYAVDDPKGGAAGSVLNLLQCPGLNHAVQVTRGILRPETEQLLTSFFQALRAGRIPRFSAEWKQRQLAKKQDSM